VVWKKFWNGNYLFEVERLQHFLLLRNSHGPQEKLSRAACGPRTVCCVGLFKVIRSAVRITIYCNMTCDLTFIIVQFESESTHKFNPQRQKQTCLVCREKTENRHSFARMFQIPLCESLVLLRQQKNLFM